MQPPRCVVSSLRNQSIHRRHALHIERVGHRGIRDSSAMDVHAIRERGIEIAELTLHVGLGTFQPVHVENVEEHKLHRENFSISEDAAEKINRALAEKRRVVAVGTTTVRTLEYAAHQSELGPNGIARIQAGPGEAEIFIYPGFQFRVTGALVTNELDITSLHVYAPMNGVGLLLGLCRLLRFNDLRIEGLQYSSGGSGFSSDLMQVGTSTTAFAVNSVMVDNAHIQGMYPGASAISFDGSSGPNSPFNVSFKGEIFDEGQGPPYGNGIVINHGRNLSLEDRSGVNVARQAAE